MTCRQDERVRAVNNIVKRKKYYRIKNTKRVDWNNILIKRKKILRFKSKGGSIKVCQWRKEVSL